MNNKDIYIRRINDFQQRVYEGRYSGTTDLKASFIYDKSAPIPYREALQRTFKVITKGEQWGELWGSGWFRFEGTVPHEYAGNEVMALIDVDGEGAVFENGSPVLGLTNKTEDRIHHLKRRVPLFPKAEGGEKVSLLVETGANSLFGNSSPAGGEKSSKESYYLNQAELVCFDSERWQLSIDLDFLLQLALSIDEKSPRHKKIIYGLNEAANVWNDGRGLSTCRKITGDLLSKKANDSAMTAWSIGHAHLDLAWLWPVRETRRKAGRSFSTALKLIKEYPGYRFGASQPQLYQWVKEDYPELYNEIKIAVKDKKWECQGAMWVEPDMNLTGGESLIRQCIFGKKYYKEEFGIDVKNLWLPDVFGYSAALPQILRKSGVDYFVTQKISWNDTNKFPHHTFNWEGIDGTKILSHFLPTNSYNCTNGPEKMIKAEERFSQSDIHDDFLNLFGIGDGGGGPSRAQIEFGKRLENTEGAPKCKFAFAEDFFSRISEVKTELPLWSGELYLEFHRGTYTSQALIKKYNRKIELLLRDVEFLSTISGEYPSKELEFLWKNTLLNQFHDILPGSSIGWVYDDAHKLSEETLKSLKKLKENALTRLFSKESEKGSSTVPLHFAIVNSHSWKRHELIKLPRPGDDQNYNVLDCHGRSIPSYSIGKEIEVCITVPSMGYTTLSLHRSKEKSIEKITGNCTFAGEWEQGGLLMENDRLRLTVSGEGTISSIVDKEEKREILKGAANRLMLWEDRPYSYEAWDISHYYRETEPEQARLLERKIHSSTPLSLSVLLKFTVGLSAIEQIITITRGSKMITIDNKVDWKESRKMLRVEADTALKTAEASYEIQYGTVKRTTHENSSWDMARFEVPAQRFADLSQPDYGLALVNDCKYGHYIKEGTMDLALLRSPKIPDPDCDMRVHEFSFGYYPHKETLERSDVITKAHDFNSPLIVQPIGEVPADREKSFYTVDNDSVKIEVVKRGENSSGTIVRLYETKGSTARVSFSSCTPWKSLCETNLLEEATVVISVENSSTELVFTPFEIKTIHLS